MFDWDLWPLLVDQEARRRAFIAVWLAGWPRVAAVIRRSQLSLEDATRAFDALVGKPR
jgi:hypothetical protein